MKDFWNREVLRVRYFKQRFEIREEELKKQKAKKDIELAEVITLQKTVRNLLRTYQRHVIHFIQKQIGQPTRRR